MAVVTLERNPMQTFLDKHRVKGKGYTFTSLGKPFGSYLIPDDKIDFFYKLYVDLVQKNREMPFLTEKPGSAPPVLVDFDYKFGLETNTRQFDMELIKKIAVAYTDCFSKYIDLQEGQSDCYVFLKPAPYQSRNKNGELKPEIKDGVHLIWPEIRCCTSLKLLARLHVMDTCKDVIMSVNPTNSLEDVVDKAVIDTNNWFVLGSGKPYGKAYDLITILKINDGQAIEKEHTYSFSELVRLLRVNRHDANVNYLPGVTEECMEALLKEKTIKPVAPKSVKPVKPSREESGSSSSAGAEVEEVSLELLQKVVMALAPFRVEHYDDWTDIVWAINNISTENKYLRKGNDLIHDFSRKAPGDIYDEQDVEHYIKNLFYRPDGKKFGTLVKLLKEDDPIVYTELFKKKKLSYDQVKEDFEQTHFKVLLPTGFVVHNELGLHPKTKKQMFDDYENKYYYETDAKGVDQKLQFFKRWIKDEDIRTFQKVDFLPPPQPCPEGTYNLYHGLRAESLSCDTAGVDLDVIFDLHSKICGNDPVFTEYSLNWWANLVQQPGKLSRVGLLWESPEGCGKNLWLNWFGQKILGEDYFFSSTDIENIYGTFAAGLKHKLLVNVNEIDAAGAHKYVERIKASITDETITFQAKHVMTVVLRNYARFVLSTNNHNVIKASVSDRRFAAVTCDSTRRNDSSYFDPVIAAMDDDRTTKAFFEYLKARDIQGWVPSRRPMTQLYKSMRALSVPLLSLWLIHLVELRKPIRDVSATHLIVSCKDWLGSQEYSEDLIKKINRTSFGVDIKRYGGIHPDRGESGSTYSIDLDELKRWLIQHQHMEQEIDFIE